MNMDTRPLILLGCLLWAGCVNGVEEQIAGTRKVEMTEGTIPFLDIKLAYKLFDFDPTPEDVERLRPTAIFLHGAKYSSDFWVQLGTLKMVAEWGTRALAVDLPGFGKTPALPYSDNNLRAELVKAIVEFAWPKPNSTVILISPSMSGRYSIPFLDRYGPMVTSYVAVAPIGVSQWGGPWEDTHKRVCALGVYGSKDKMAQDALRLVKLFEKAWSVVIPDAGHRSYEDKPDAWHKVLLPFLRKCNRKPDGEHAQQPDSIANMNKVIEAVGELIKI